MDQVFQIIKFHIAEIRAILEERITPRSSFVDDLDLDELDAVELAIALEESLGTDFIHELDLLKLHELDTVSNLVSWVTSKLPLEKIQQLEKLEEPDAD